LINAYIGLGSNLGNREANVRSAVTHLDSWDGVRVVALSSFYETEPVGPVQPDYINAVCAVKTTLSARQLLNALLTIEARHGRKRSIRWGPRTLDLDLLLYGDAVINERDLVVPHPHMHERRFVLEPLCEIAPDVVHPVFGLTVRRLKERLEGEQNGGDTHKRQDA